MSTTPVETNTNVQILGHRGAIYKAVENTLEAFQSCLELDGCHGVELDVFLLKDGSLVVFHGTGGDVTPGLLDQYCESKHDASSILDLTLPQVQDLSFVQESDHLVAPEEVTATARIPTLQEVLELFRRYPTKRLAIELKGTGTVEPTVKLVQDMGMEHQVIFSSFDHSRIHRVAEMNPSLRTAALFKAQVPEEFLELAEKARADEIHLRYDTCSVDRVQAAHQHGFKVMAWFRGPKAMQQDLSDTYVDISNEVSVYKMVMQTGVDAIICNRPHCAVELIRSEERGHEAAAASFDEMEAEQPLETPGETRMPIAVSAN
jgi:glycerophosphoryl diester phosphodiesterase